MLTKNRFEFLWLLNIDFEGMLGAYVRVLVSVGAVGAAVPKDFKEDYPKILRKTDFAPTVFEKS